MRKKGFTLIELLIVIAIIALLMAILVPAVARARIYAYRMICGSNLGGIGKGVILYAGDAKDEYPTPGIARSASLNETGWMPQWHDPYSATGGGGAGSLLDPGKSVYGPDNGANGGKATIGSIFYLLVKYEDVSVKQFTCKGDTGVRTFKMTDYTTGFNTNEFTKVWDFGKKPGMFCSYSYHNPFKPMTGGQTYPVNTNSPPAAPLAADRNPTLDKNVTYIASGGASGSPGGTLGTGAPTGAILPSDSRRWAPPTNEYKDPDLLYNAFAHLQEGQNVLYNDGHVRFEKQANVGVDNDNIWQCWYNNTTTTTVPDKKGKEVNGYFPYPGWTTAPANTNCPSAPNQNNTWYPRGTGDAMLVNETQYCGIDPFSGPPT